MVRELRLARRADHDLDDIYRHGVEAFGLAVADRYAVAMMATLDGLCAFPFSGSSVESSEPGLRRKPCGAHLIFYRVNDKAVEVIRILHQHMDPARHL